MKNGVLLTLIVVGAIVMSAAIATAQESQVVHYQGILLGSDGNPVPDGEYNVQFSIWDAATGGEQLWLEEHAIETSGGSFNVNLGDIEPYFVPLHDDGNITFLEIQVEGDLPMTPRRQVGTVPTAFVSSRMLGDIQTGEGSLFLLDPGGDSAISMLADGTDNTIKVNWPEPQGVASSAIELANVGNTGSRIWMYHPEADPPGPMVEINADPTAGSSIIIHSAEPLLGGSVDIRGTPTSGGIITLNTNPAPHEEIKVIEMSSASPNGGTIKMFNSQLEPPPVLMEMSTSFNAGEFGASFVMFNPQPEPPGEPDPWMAMSTGPSTGASFVMFNPQPEPPGSDPDPFIEMQTFENSASFVMFNPQPEPPGQDPLMGMFTNPLGANFEMTAPGMGRAGAEITDPIIEMATDASGGDFRINWAEPLGVTSPAIEIANVGNTGSRIWMYHPLADPPGPMVEINADPTNGSSIAIHSAEPLLGEGVKIAGTSTIGGIITLNTNPAPHEEVKVIELSSESPNGGSFKMFNPEFDPPPALMEMSTSFNARELGASLVMFNPQPEPPGRAIMEMSTSIAGPSFKMTSPQAPGGGLEITDPLLEITADNTGASIKLFDTSGGTTVEISNDGDIEAKRGNFGSGNTLTGSSAFVAGSFNTVGGQEAFAAGESNTVNGFRATILGGDNNTANGVRSTVCGGSYNSVHATSSVIPGGYNSTINSTALYSCLIGIDASLSEDSTFMVDMPHIRFGNASGYEFPTVDGDADQVMITDGSGQLSWVDLARIYGGGIEKLANTIEELKRQNSELERRIAELEAERR